jgi:hypothetical protein
MKNRSLSELAGVLAIVLPGGVAAFVVARTLAAYWGRDWLASLIVAAIGAALALGLLELFARLLRAGSLERELRALPPLPNEATIESASPRLSALLRARLESMPLPNAGEGSASFLTGLLVMLGLLGTLLGLFQTVSGAGHALTGSADIEGLRRSLSAPIDGLTRSFGCSAAGISASAMLGLAIALVRRREVRTQRLFYAYATGPLRTLSPLRRQMRALEQLVTQGSALPSAANALEEVGATLGDLSTQLISLQQAALKSQQRAFSDLLASVRGEFTKAAGETGEALHARVSPLLEQMATRSGEALVAQAGALAEVAREVTQQIERDAEVRREAAAQASAALQARFDEAERVHATARAQELAALTGLAGQAARDGERREQTFAERWSELLERFDAQLTAAGESEQERRRSHATWTSAAREREEAVSAAARERETAWINAAREREAVWTSAAHERDGLALGRLDEVTTRVGSELERLSSSLAGQVEQRAQSERTQDERAERTLLQLKAAADALAHGRVEQAEAQKLALTRLQSSLEESTARQAQVVESGIARQVQLVEASVARQESALTEQATVVESGIARQVQLVETSVAQQAVVLTQQAEVVESSITRQVALLEQSVAQQNDVLERGSARQAELLDAAFERQSNGLEDLTARVKALLPELADAAQVGAVNTLARLGELVEAQAARFAELEATIERGRVQHSSGLGDQLASHAADLEQRLARTSTAVQDAAAIWQASSAEMQSVAELFANSVERQREASDAWLESFGEVEAAVERAGRDAARDALSEQLASTQEVFARQLQFQRELFEQLRTLRAAPSGASHGEHDVSV